MMKYIYYHSYIIHHGRRLSWRGNSEEQIQEEDERRNGEGIPKGIGRIDGGVKKENEGINGETNGGITKENERTNGTTKKDGRKGWELGRIKKEKRTRRNAKN